MHVGRELTVSPSKCSSALKISNSSNKYCSYEIQGIWEVSGAQEPRAFEMLFKRWKEMEKKGEAEKVQQSVNGTACL